MYRTHTCGELTEDDIGLEVKLSGWVNSIRDHGGVIFIDLRDRYGLTQIVFDPRISKEAHSIAEKVHDEYVINIEGTVFARSADTINPKLVTGHIEVKSNSIEVLSKSDVLPFQIDDEISVGEDIRLKYRFLDLRRNDMRERVIIRHKISRAVREFLYKNDFLEIETPFLTKSTPEGARDYLVASRIYPGKFYALPQSPQLFKQILMVSGFDRYFQIVKCFRDEDLRADRQPEFTQIDMEMSFIDMKDIMTLVEGMFKMIFKSVANKSIPAHFNVLEYDRAIELYGTDKPDMRNPLRLYKIDDIVADSKFNVFVQILKKGGIVRGLNAVGCADFSRKDIDDLTRYVSDFGAKGMAWFKVTDSGPESSIAKFFTDAQLKELQTAMEAKPGDLLLFIADKEDVVYNSLANLRDEVARRKGLIKEGVYEFLWVTNFPLFHYNKQEERWDSVHHPFTAPNDEDIQKLESDPGAVHSKAYDLVLNGMEVGGGSIRIHNSEVQQRIFALLGISEEEAHRKFDFLLNAFRFGAPPHGGIAFGLDRMAMILTGSDSIRDVIPFPKTQRAVCMLTDAPSEVADKQLKELGIKIDLT